MGTIIQYQISSKSVELDPQGIAAELRTKLLVKFFCGHLNKEEQAEDDKPKLRSWRFMIT